MINVGMKIKVMLSQCIMTYHPDDSGRLADSNDKVLHCEFILRWVWPVNTEKCRQHPLELSLVGKHVRQHCYLITINHCRLSIKPSTDWSTRVVSCKLLLRSNGSYYRSVLTTWLCERARYSWILMSTEHRPDPLRSTEWPTDGPTSQLIKSGY